MAKTASRAVPGKVVPFSLLETARKNRTERNKSKMATVKVTNGEIYVMGQQLGELQALDVPARVGYHLARLGSKVSSAFRDIEAVRVQLVQKYGEKNEKGQPQVGPNSENWDKFATEYEELMNIEADLEANVVRLPGDTKASIKLLMAFEKFIELAEEPQ